MKRILLFFAALAVAFSAMATDVTVLVDAVEASNDGVTVTCAKGNGNNAPVVQSGGFVRLYANNTVTITSSTSKIASMTIGWSKNTSKAYATASADCGTYTDPASDGSTIVYGTWTGSANTIVFSIGSSGQKQIHSVEVTFESESGEDQPTLASIAVSGAPTKTVYQEGETFNPAGLTVTGTYINASTSAITSGITWTMTPSTGLTAGTTSVSVVATVGEISSAAFTVEGLTVNAVTPITCAEANALEANAAAVLGEVTVVYVNGLYNYVKDASGYTLVYGANSDWTAGDVVASVSGVASPYHGLPELKVNSFDGIEVAHGGAAPQPELQTAAPTAADVHRFVKFEGVSVAAGSFTTSSATNLNMTLADGTTVTLRNAFKLAQTFAAGKTYDVVGLVAIYDTNIQVYFVSAEEQEVEGAVAAPEITPAATSFYGSMEVTITAEEGLLLAYTLDGSTPVENENATFSTGNTATFTIDATTTVKAAAYNSNGVFSEVVTKEFVKITTVGDGTEENPFTVEDVKALNNILYGTYWVIGEIAGSATSATKIAETPLNTNIALGTADNFIPVALPSGDVRDALNIVDNPELIGQTVKVYGTLEVYFKTAGVKNTSDYRLETAEVDYYMVGSEELFGEEGMKMIDNEDGTYTLTLTNVVLAGGDYTYNVAARPVVEEDAESAPRRAAVLPAEAKSFTLEAGTYSLKFDYNAETGELTSTNMSNGFATGIDEVEAASAKKLVRDGKIVIIKNGVEYSVLGQKL